MSKDKIIIPKAGSCLIHLEGGGRSRSQSIKLHSTAPKIYSTLKGKYYFRQDDLRPANVKQIQEC